LQPFFQELKELCNQHFFKEKVLIVPSYSMGRQILQAYTMAGNASLNFKINTLHGLANEFCSSYLHKHNLSLISEPLAKYYVMVILQQLKEKGELSYFDQLEISTGFTSSMYQSIQELKYAGCQPRDLASEHFQNAKKASDMKLIFAAYEQNLAENSYIDSPSLLQLAITESSLLSSSNQVYIVVEQPDLHLLEKNVIEKLVYINGYKISLPPVSQDTLHKNINASKIEMSRSYGENNECREVIRYIKENKPLIKYQSCTRLTNRIHN
jgi:ATP-dependent helicase/DNAse subunit B